MVHYVSSARGPTRDALIRGEQPKWIANSKRAKYIAQVVLSAPPWVDRKALMALHAEAKALTQETGVQHVMAHIVPLNHPHVCGLTVPWNIKIVPWRVNAAESNWFTPDQVEMF